MSNLKDDLIEVLKNHNVAAFAISVLYDDNIQTLLGGDSRVKATMLAVEMAKDAIEELGDEECDCPNCKPKKEPVKKEDLSKEQIADLVGNIIKHLKEI